MTMDRYDKERASRRVAEYFWRHPHEHGMSQDQNVFDRAKAETINVMQDALDRVKELQFADFDAQLKRGKIMKKVETTPFWPSPCERK